MPDRRSIGVFDSGVGGLTVLRALHERLPHESTIYLGDLARCPYGIRSSWEIRGFAIQIADLLVSRDIKVLVVACNTATATALPDLCARYPIPVVGVIAPGAREAMRQSVSGRIGVLATDATVASHAYRAAVCREREDAVVIERSASWLVPLVERGTLARPTAARQLASVVADMRRFEIDTLILGCTHFPLVRDLFEEAIGEDIAIVDSAQTTAHEVAAILDRLDMRGAGATHRILVTGPPEAFAERAQAMFHTSPAIETVDLALQPGQVSMPVS